MENKMISYGFKYDVHADCVSGTISQII